MCGAAMESELSGTLCETEALLAAARLAVRCELAEVVWPLHGGSAADPDLVDVDLAAQTVSRCLLVERLLIVEGAPAPVVSAPFADLCDRRLADLAIDMGLIPGDVWWSAGTSDAQRVAAERWARAFEASGVPLRLASAGRAGSGPG